MKNLISIIAVWVLFVLVMIVDSNATGCGCTDFGYDKYNWSCQNFPGFYYNLDQNICTEVISFRLSDITPDKSKAALSDQFDGEGFRGVTYITKAKIENFEYAPWGAFDVIGFMGEKYLAAYNPSVTSKMVIANENVPFLYDRSNSKSLMADEQISRVLVDDDTARTITYSNPLMLEEGYKLALKSIDASSNKVYLELSKNGQAIDAKVIQPSKPGAIMADKTYYYKTTIGNTSNIVQIAVHFKNGLIVAGTSIATVEGVFQLSDTPTPLKVDQQYEKMSVRNIDQTSMTVFMDNMDNQITLSKNRDTLLMGNIHIRTADQDNISVDNPLRYCLYKG